MLLVVYVAVVVSAPLSALTIAGSGANNVEEAVSSVMANVLALNIPGCLFILNSPSLIP